MIPGASTGDHRDAGLRQQPRGLDCGGVVGIIGLGPGRAEDRDPVPHIRQVVESPDELPHDAKHAPGVGDEELLLFMALPRLRPLEKGLVLGWTLVVVHRPVRAICHGSP